MRFFYNCVRPDVGNVVAAQCNVDLHTGRHVVANHLNHVALGLEARSRPVSNFHLNKLTLFSTGITPWRHQHFLLNFRVIGHNKANAAFFVIATNNAFVGTGDHLNHRTFTTTTAIKTRNPRQSTVTIEHQAHLRGTQKQIITAIIRHQKAKTITVPAHAPKNQVELINRGIGAAAGIDQLAITLHGAKTATQGFELLFSGHAKFISQLFASGWRAALIQVLQNQFTTWNGVFIFFRFTSGLGIEGLPIGH